MAGVKGMKHRRPRTETERDTYAANRIEYLLDQYREGKIEIEANRLKAMQIRYDKLRPALSAVEQTTTDQRDTLSETEIQAKMTALLDAHPGLLERIIAAKARANRGEPATIAVQQGPQEATAA